MKPKARVLGMITVPPETEKVGPRPVAVWCGLEMKVQGDRVLSFLFCSNEASTSGFFVEGAKPSDEDEDMVRCPHCEVDHYVVRLADAVYEQKINLEEAGPGISLSDLLSIFIREGARPAGSPS